MFKGRGIIVFTVLFVLFSFSNNVFSENIKIQSDNIKLQSASGSSESPGLSAGEVNVSGSETGSVNVGQESITLEGAGAEGIKAGTLNITTSISEPATPDSTVNEPKAKKKRYEGVSISKAEGAITSASINSAKPKNMKQVKNLGKPEGVHAMAQSVKAEVKYSDSPRMNKMKERKTKRRANMKKELKVNRKALN